MVIFKSGIGAKLVLGLLGVALGVGGVAAGAQFRAAHPNAQHRHVFAGLILEVRPHAILVRTRSGATLTIYLTAHTALWHNGRKIAQADLARGQIIVGTVATTKQGLIYATIIRVVREPKAAQGP